MAYDLLPDAYGDGLLDVKEVLIMDIEPFDPDSVPALGDVGDTSDTNNVDAIWLFNLVLGNVAELARLDRADVRVDGLISNVNAIVFFNWVLGAVAREAVRIAVLSD